MHACPPVAIDHACPKKEGDGLQAYISSIRFTALRNSYEYRRASNHRAQLLQRRGGAIGSQQIHYTIII